jgi:glycosyltransferase involved in cell wall biosynthesis
VGLIKLNYACFLNKSGYSQAAQNMLSALHQSEDFDIKIRIFGEKPTRASMSDDKYEYFMKRVKKEKDPERILIYHCIPTMQKRELTVNKSIGFAIFETFNPPLSWIDVLNKNDAIVVPSQFNYRVFAHEAIKKPLYYIPHCIDFSVYNSKVSPLYSYKKFTFLFMGTWKERKGYPQLIEAWFKEFSSSDDVQLIIKTDRPKQAEQYINQVKKQMGINKGFAPILLENKVFDETMLPRFIKSANCLISSSIGEGFGYPGLQCMALGVPVIITNFSGCTDYANEETAILIEPTGYVFRKDMDSIPQFRNKKWAFIEVKNIQKTMRSVFENPSKAELKASRAYSYVRSRFDYKTVGILFKKMIREIYG